MRCFIKKPKSRLNTTPALQIYDEDESLLKMDDLTKEKSIMGLLEISGLKFTSQSFSLEFNLTQAMVLKEKVFRNKCLIKTVNANNQENQPQDKVYDEIPPKDDKDAESEDAELVQNLSDDEEPDDGKIQEYVDEVQVETEPVVPTLKLSELQSKNIKLNVVDNDTSQINEDDTVANQLTLTNLENTEPNAENTESIVEDLAKSEDKTEEKNEANLKGGDKLLVNTEPLEKNSELNEINLVMPEDKDTVQLKKPNEVYMEIYKEVKRRAKEAKKKAIAAYLEAKRIKSLYLLDEIESSDDETDLLEMTTN